VDILRGSRSQPPVRRSSMKQRHLLRFLYTAICRHKKTITLDPSGAGSQSLRISLPKHFWPLTGAHDSPINSWQMVRIRRFGHALTDATLGSEDAVTMPQVAPSVFARWLKWHPHNALICHFLCQDWVLVPNKDAQPQPAESS